MFQQSEPCSTNLCSWFLPQKMMIMIMIMIMRMRTQFINNLPVPWSICTRSHTSLTTILWGKNHFAPEETRGTERSSNLPRVTQFQGGRTWSPTDPWDTTSYAFSHNTKLLLPGIWFPLGWDPTLLFPEPEVMALTSLCEKRGTWRPHWGRCLFKSSLGVLLHKYI